MYCLKSRIVPRAVLAGVLAGVFASGPEAGADNRGSDIEMSTISGEPDAPRRHFRLRYPAQLSGQEAESFYQQVRSALALGYRAAGLPEVQGYQQWQRHNAAPYLSSTHGNHYLNNYVNERAAAHYQQDSGVPMPGGSIIAKDSFSVTRTGGIVLGPLFVMEKMAPGFDPGRGDWRYTLVQPNGDVIGRGGEPSGKRLEYCVACHLVVEKRDYLYGVPAGARALRAQ